MYHLKNLKNGLYQIHSSRHKNAYEGTASMVLRMAVQMGIEEKELSKAVNILLGLDHDLAVFDWYGKFVKTNRNPMEGGPGGFSWH